MSSASRNDQSFSGKSSKLITGTDPSVGVTAEMEDLGEVKWDWIERGENRGE